MRLRNRTRFALILEGDECVGMYATFAQAQRAAERGAVLRQSGVLRETSLAKGTRYYIRDNGETVYTARVGMQAGEQ